MRRRLGRHQLRQRARALGLSVVRGEQRSHVAPLPPVVDAVRVDGGYRVLHCPFCGAQTHFHGFDGWRTPDCVGGIPEARVGYVVRARTHVRVRGVR